jgi:chromate transporter
VLPSFCIIFLISSYLDRFLEIAWIASAFRGIKIAVGILIFDAAVKMVKKMKKKPMPVTIMLCGFAAMLGINVFSVKVSSILLMVIAGVVNLVLYTVNKPVGGAGK